MPEPAEGDVKFAMSVPSNALAGVSIVGLVTRPEGSRQVIIAPVGGVNPEGERFDVPRWLFVNTLRSRWWNLRGLILQQFASTPGWSAIVRFDFVAEPTPDGEREPPAFDGLELE